MEGTENGRHGDHVTRNVGMGWRQGPEVVTIRGQQVVVVNVPVKRIKDHAVEQDLAVSS